ncbi:hypothetical protein [Haloplanus aerogenes]|uniref:Uncharacterized protein n=1 Tax=Haloplanus aerogenes TaxID=660522 RepID=A0A3M0CHK0_9EURY|nr:hypothetical protein [Haloplanus aerogenes]AZH26840.1 hypothetical protein DU502_16310 [Haloplanus aerogenes]RMB09068.1 hypothetical protein ATH50_3438 [Haloplanus aerogenes]
MARIDGVKVSEGGKVLWPTVASLLVGAPIYAIQQGYVETIQLFGSGLGKVVRAPGSFLAEWLGLLFSGGSRAISASWWSFLRDVTSVAGPASFVVIMLGVVVTLFILSWGVRRIGV